MSVKLNHYWSIIPGKYDEYYKFVIKKFIPGINHLGIHTVAVWSVIIGEYSEIICETTCSDLQWIKTALTHHRYKSLKNDLMRYVKGYQTKVLINTERVTSHTMDIREGTIKFNQMWDVQPHKKEAYETFFFNEYVPILNDVSISIAGEWEVLIGDGPGIVCEGRVANIDTLINHLKGHKFQNAKRALKQLVENYRSRILTFHIRKIKGYKSTSYQLIDN